MTEKYLTVHEVAATFGVTEATVRNWMKTGQLEAIKLNARVIRIPESAVQSMMKAAS